MMTEWTSPIIRESWWDKIIPEPNSGCWFWLGCLHRDGYGKVSWRVEGTQFYAYIHRIVYESYKGQISEGLELDHKCLNKQCCNPDHLQPVTHRVNMRRMRNHPMAETEDFCRNGHRYSETERFYSDGKRRCRLCPRKSKLQA